MSRKRPIPHTAMLLAAGLGTRMRPLTDSRPKALVEFAGRPLIAHQLDRLAEAGVQRVVINGHHFLNNLKEFIDSYKGPLELLLSEEKEAPLDSGGGVKKARAMLGDRPIFVLNCDAFWRDGRHPLLVALAERFDSRRMDALWSVVPSVRALGCDGRGDVFMDGAGRIAFLDERQVAPFVYGGVHILKPGLVDEIDKERFSLIEVWRQAAERGRLYGLLHEGFWAHLGTPQALVEAERALGLEATQRTHPRGEMENAR
ncbi:MAG: nucleotidyltransferase family protein [Alphaproteobacteria bacterium]|nr:MAG: nucleotidyltransferase family protein [Alphaproteobacteria bacterium]